MQTESRKRPVSAEALERKHEPENPPAGWVGLAGVLVLLMIAASIVICRAMMKDWSGTRPLDPGIRERGTIIAPDVKPLQRFARPNLQINPHGDLLALQAHENAELNGYGWIDRKTGVVRIPVERAMELIAQRGLPARAANQPARTGKSEFELARERPAQP